jgi:hypothetical protein
VPKPKDNDDQVFSSIFKYFLKSPKKRIIRVCLNRIESMSLLWLLDTWYMQCWWMGSRVSTKFCILPSLVISLNFGIWNKQFQEILILEKNNLIPTEAKKGIGIHMIRWVPRALQKDCLPYASRHAHVTCMQWQWNSFYFLVKFCQNVKFKMKNSKKKCFCKSSVTKSEGRKGKNCKNCKLGFHCVATSIERWLNICNWFLVYSLDFPIDDRRFGYKQKFLKKTLF